VRVVSGRVLIVGRDDAGRSCVVEDREVSLEGVAPGTAMAQLFTSEATLGPYPAGLGTFVLDRLAPGQVSFRIIEREPGSPSVSTDAGTELRNKNTLELAMVLEGGGELVLGDGTHTISAGDCMVLPGSDHALRTGPHGCRLLAVDIGTTPPS
jgi:mannose-6-phosphate isomerase-like protein (cupin superfamily)